MSEHENLVKIPHEWFEIRLTQRYLQSYTPRSRRLITQFESNELRIIAEIEQLEIRERRKWQEYTK